MGIKYGEPLLFKPQNVCKRSGRIKVLSITNKVEDTCSAFHLDFHNQLCHTSLPIQAADKPASHWIQSVLHTANNS